ncbi:unknown [Hapavirus wongabel]|uniref:Uncharacterized protein U4 n=1 Tax=Hapavirus wongabel TaxID=1972626 RepID=B2X7D2_9RHAB|nr:hypothetical protein WoV_gp02 [Hapavirus wongabel]ABV01357.1 unknown [Hapavirus wongabel]
MMLFKLNLISNIPFVIYEIQELTGFIIYIEFPVECENMLFYGLQIAGYT